MQYGIFVSLITSTDQRFESTRTERLTWHSIGSKCFCRPLLDLNQRFESTRTKQEECSCCCYWNCWKITVLLLLFTIADQRFQSTHIRARGILFMIFLESMSYSMSRFHQPTRTNAEKFSQHAQKFREQHLFGEEHIFTLPQHFRSTQTSSIAFVPLVNALSRHGLIEVVREAEKNVSVVLFWIWVNALSRHEQTAGVTRNSKCARGPITGSFEIELLTRLSVLINL